MTRQSSTSLTEYLKDERISELSRNLDGTIDSISGLLDKREVIIVENQKPDRSP